MIGALSRRRVALTFLDQLLWSTSNFAIGLAIARFTGPAEFGKYMLVFMIWLIVVGTHRALITEPVIISSREAQDRRSLLAGGVSAELLFGAVVSFFFGAGGLLILPLSRGIGLTILALCPWFVVLLIQDYWRAMAFLERRPELALANDALCGAVQFALMAVFAIVGWRSAGHMITAWGAGAAAGAVLGFRWFAGTLNLTEGWRLVRRLWSLSRWLLADFLTTFGSHYSYLAVAALLIPAVGYGGFRAALNLMGPVVVIVTAGANLALPDAMCRVDAADPQVLGRFARRVSACVTVCIALYALVVAVAGRRLMSLVYGPRFGRFAPLATLAAVEWVIAGTWFGQGIALKATGAIRRLWRVRFVVMFASELFLFVLVRALGTSGAAWAGVCSTTLYAIGVFTIYRGEMRQASLKPADGATGQVGPEPAMLSSSDLPAQRRDWGERP